MKRVCTAVVAVMTMIACQESTSTPIATTATAADSADQFMVGMEVLLHEGGLKRARVLADTAYFFNDNTRLRMHGVSAEFFTSTGASDGRMTAKVAHYDTRQMHLEAFGDVVLISVEGRRLSTAHLIYDQAQNQMSGDSAFTLTDPENSIVGVGFTTTPNLTSVSVGRNIRGHTGTLNVPDR